MNKLKNICGENIAKARNQLQSPMTQEQLAAKLQQIGVDIDRATVAKIETKHRRVYDYEVLAFAKVLNVSPLTLLGHE